MAYYRINSDGTASDGNVIGVPTPDGVMTLTPDNWHEHDGLDGWEWHDDPPQWWIDLQEQEEGTGTIE